MALLLTICFTNFYLTRSLFRHISEPLDELVAGVERIQRGDLDSPIAYAGSDDFKAACDAVDLMSAKLKAALEAEISAVTADYADRADIDMRVPSGCTVYADRSQLRRIAKNIIDNSIKYAGPGRVRAVISAAERGDKVEFSFDDNGPGVPDEHLPRLFDVFYRTDPARKRGADGSGLGLAIVSRWAARRRHAAERSADCASR